jgi:thiazole/oxazole-forming peptide maturase SagD family component
MQVLVSDGDLNTRYRTKTLVRRTLGQLCGLQQNTSFLLRGRYDPRVVVCGVELTGVHVLQGRPKPPGVSPYHIGGAGLVSDEALIRAVGETLERYSQLVVERAGLHDFQFASHNEMRALGAKTIAMSALQMYADDQYGNAGFPFYSIDSDDILAWVAAESLIDGSCVWVPAQIVFVGYAAQGERGEKRFAPAVTTGSAAHTAPIHALRNSLLELIQLDSTIGHWYSPGSAYRIEQDSRTTVISRVLERYFHALGPEVEFYLLPNADLPGFTVSCLLWGRVDVFPRVAIGLGSELCLGRAMYKALLEAVGVLGLSKVTLLEGSIDTDSDSWKEAEVDPEDIFNLDANILYFGFPSKAAIVERKFSGCSAVRARELPPDILLDPDAEVRMLVHAFENTGKELVVLDLTTCDIRELGFTALRVWSPDTLSLSLPSAPPLNHPRLNAYGGAADNGPHPYA